MPDLTTNTRRVEQMHRRNELEQHFFAPGSVERHERLNWRDVLLVLVIYVAGPALLAALFGFGAYLGNRLIALITGA